MIIKANNEDTESYDLRFRASEFVTDPTQHPYLEVIWSQDLATTYFLKDHLGSIRATVDQSGNVLGFDDYDPWGLTLADRSQETGAASVQGTSSFKFTGKELDDENGLDWYYFGARFYDPRIGRFLTVDRFADKYPAHTPYHYTLNNPVRFIDINGDSTFVAANDDGTYTVTGVNLSGEDDDTGIFIRGQDGNLTLVGQSVTSHSFVDDKDNAVVGAVIDPTSTEGQDFVDGLIAADPGLISYMENATGGEVYDFKTKGINQRPAGTTELQYKYRGSLTSDGRIGSARDFGNIGAGIVAGRKGLFWVEARLGFDTLESWQKGRITSEGTSTKKAQRIGHKLGGRLRISDVLRRIGR